MMPIAATLADWVASGRSVVHELDTKSLLAEAGIPVPRRDPAIGRCAVKIASDLHPHKTEHGLVRLGVAPQNVQSVVAELASKVSDGAPLVEEMITDGIAEWIIGCRHDPTFGPIVVIGAGGVHVELLDEAKVRLAPVDHDAARRAIESQRGARILAGARGNPPGDIEALAALVVRLSRFFADQAVWIDEIEINPVIVRPRGAGVIAADALMKLRSAPGE
jgi:acetate---CoA ligase (ADP-forming) subunit beta